MTVQTIGDVRKLIRKAKAVYIRPFFGVLEGWIKISKPEAFGLFAAYDDQRSLVEALDFDHTLTIEDNGDLYLG
jgi:hypothetical protein